MFRALLVALALLSLAGGASSAPKFGPDAKVITDNIDYFRRAQAIDYWTLSPFYVGQQTAHDSSVASATMIVNAMRGVPADADDTILAPDDLLAQVANRNWILAVGDSGADITFDTYLGYLKETIVATALGGTTIVAEQPKDAEQLTLTNFRNTLITNEASKKDAMLVYFDRGVVTGGATHPQVSPVGAYDAINDLVLILDVDRGYYVPYWVPATTLLVAMFNQFPGGPQKGKSGGYYVIARP